MAEIIKMPRLSDTMEEGTVAKWLKQVGDKIEEGDILAEIETDKATMEFESFYEGTLLHIGIEEGDGAPVDALLAIVGEEGEDISGLIDGAGSGDAGAGEDTKETVAEEAATGDGSEDAETASGDDAGGQAEVPEGVEIIRMPRLSDTMEEGTVASWIKKKGDAVEEGDILAEIETDKATMEFESFYSGTLLHIGIEEGESAPVDAVLAVIGPEGTDVEAVLSAGSGSGKPAATEEKGAEAKKESSEEKAASTDGAAAGREEARSGGSSSGDGRIFISPLARKMAEEKGIDLSDVEGTGDNGRIVKRDIENYTPSAKPAASVGEGAAKAPAEQAVPASAASMAPAGEESVEEVKNSQMRKVIAKRLSESKFTAPHYYLTIEVDMSQAMASRARINELPDTKVSFNDMVVKACAMALRKHPQVNTTWNGDTTKYNGHVHIGVAVAVEEGLVVPVLKFTDQMSLTAIGASVKDLAGRARNKKLTPAEMEGSTFTVSNLGMFGIREFTSIINQPNSAILSVGAIVEKPVVRDGQIVVGHTMTITLACDHRTVDGATGAQFLQTLRAYLEHPVTMLA
ncbi:MULTISPECIES: pyruvate dehydrogenase complex dihydrolipoamide acetyltransferase [Robiginitalea]|uniref:Acetyltransferase component of pyruvate dehydrogenase complex n=1 Tax=Robiginitalea biformata (strain ATCC BAA-864 / DSM 15991 / KCTC 12146 / HTCC2501) TaxID=313596 RepID=A4CJP9_ROBBH|nr:MULTISPECIES: pyruvate dehydrogenase complex dihydrolipoamide acetyltransferase [Robiginitalea]EAR17157.1 Dihydrolipoamide acetyltransferase component (E2) of pyruvate dehydrogenase complex [Robiginitalea biformata HTCC2501]MDC6355549.1 pyruvate dehydrogenase complex dihydrolipoamide acetyltransferase [Robiginitalea sp. PM2]MDC6375841.1 pyruvate dehydrogenase complex dihydrolipoamide acetyltransferase [Robiginitalea sp. SP8]